MSITIELTYDMSKALGTPRIEVDAVETVAQAVEAARARFEQGGDFEKLSKTAAIAVNGVLVNHRRGMRTRLRAGDKVTFVKAAAGG